MADAPIWLAEIGAHTGSATTTLRYSAGGYTTRPLDTPANTLYDDRIVSIGRFSSHMFGRGRLMGPAEVEMGEITLSNADRQLDSILDYGVDGRPVTLRRLRGRRSAIGTSEIVLLATAEQLDRGGLTDIRLRFYDRRRMIDKPIQTNRYGGTVIGTSPSADGGPDMKGQFKPLVFGRTLNITPVIANPHDLILQVNDGPVVSIDLFDGGAPLINAGNFPTLEALRNASISPGQYGTCLTLGLCRPGGSFNGRPGYTWTADVTEGDTLSQRSAAAVTLRMLNKLGVASGDIVTASFSALGSAAPQEVGIFIDKETSGLTAMRQVLDSVGAAILPTAMGQFAVYRLSAPSTPTVTLRESDIDTDYGALSVQSNPDTDGNLPARQVTLRWGRNWSPHSESDIAVCAADKAPFLTQEWREVSATNAAILTKHPLAPEMVFETVLLNEADAAAEAARRLTLFGQSRLVAGFAVSRAVADTLPLNTTVQVPPIGAGLGRPMVVIGRDENFDDETVDLTLWG